MKISKERLREIIREELQKEDFGMAAKQMQPFSSKEAKTIIDSSLRDWAKILRKAQYKVIKDGPDIYDFNLIQGYKIADLLDEIQLRSVNNPALSKGAGSPSGLGQNALLYGGLGLAALLAYRRFSKKK